MSQLFQSIGIVIVLVIFIIAFVGMMYVSYILAIGVLVIGSIAGIYYLLKTIKESDTLNI